jgi:hypothetical protein
MLGPGGDLAAPLAAALIASSVADLLVRARR